MREVVADALLRHDVAQQEAAASRHAERQPVGGGDVVEMIAEDDAAGALHVARDDRRIARECISRNTRVITRISPSTPPPGGKPAMTVERLAGIEILGRARAAQTSANTQQRSAQ